MADTAQPEDATGITAEPGKGSRAASVFVSHSSLDASVAGALCDALERHGHDCWIAPRDVMPGELYASAIVRAIDAATVMLLVLSPHSVQSPHVLREVERAVSRRRSVLVLRIDHAQMPPALEYFLNASHWLDASGTDVSRKVPSVVAAIGRLIGPSIAARSVTGVPAPDSQLESGGGIHAPAHAKSIAVLPFANMSADPEQEYFSDGLAEEIINLLARIPGLTVIARTSSFAFRGKSEDVRGIAAALGVTHLLEGSVRRSGNRLRIAAQLLDAADGTQVWSERFDRELSDIFAIQDEISTAIVDALRVKLAAEAGPKRYTPNLPAYEAYLRARHFANSVSPNSLELARQCFEEAIRLDPQFPLPHIGLGHYWISVMIFGRGSAHQAVPAARDAAGEALRLDPSLPDGHALLGVLAAMYDFDWVAAERHFDFPLAKRASFATLRPAYAWFQFLRGDTDAAIALARRGLEENPMDVWPHMNLQAFLQWGGRPEDALVELEKVLQIDENQVVAMVAMALIYTDLGDVPRALAIAQRAHAVAPWYLDATAVLAALLLRCGEVDASLPLSRQVTAAQGTGDAPAHVLYHLLCGEIDQGADWAERSIDDRDGAISVYLRFVVCSGLRASHRWAKIAGMLRLPASIPDHD